jgi:hypothetical protein
VKSMVSVGLLYGTDHPVLRYRPSGSRCSTCFWCWRMRGGSFCILASPLIRLRNGPLSNCGRRFRGTARRDS